MPHVFAHACSCRLQSAEHAGIESWAARLSWQGRETSMSGGRARAHLCDFARRAIAVVVPVHARHLALAVRVAREALRDMRAGCTQGVSSGIIQSDASTCSSAIPQQGLF